MDQHAGHSHEPKKKRFHLRSRRPSEPLSRESPRFHIFLIDTGWNGPVSRLLRHQLPLFRDYHPQDPLYMLTPEQSITILKNSPEHIGLDPMVVVYDLHSPTAPHEDEAGHYRGFRLNLGLIKNPEQALQRLQHFLRFIAMNRSSDCLECEIRRELHKEGVSNMIRMLHQASEASLELL